VLGGHGHSHGEGDGHEGHDHSHGHSHDKVRDAEEGHNHSHNGHSHNGHSHDHDAAGAHGHTAHVLPEGVTDNPDSRRIKFTASEETASNSRASNDSVRRSDSRQSRRHRRRTSSILNNRLSHIEDLSIHPASFRNEIIAASRPRMDGIESEEGSDEDSTGDNSTPIPTESSPLLGKGKNGNGNTAHHGHSHDHSANHDHEHGLIKRPRHDSWHAEHNHNKPRKASASHGHNHDDMGMRAMVLHVIGDALGNVGVIVSALIIWLTPWSGRFYADPAVSLFITLIILQSTIPLTSATAKILLQATPDHLDVNDIKEDIQDIPGVVSCHHVHIWQLSDSQIIASMHIQVSFPISEEGGSERYMELAKAARKCLHAYGIHSATIQPEFCLDKDHDHGETGGLGYDGEAAAGTDSDDCLLECVDDCQGKGCCKPTVGTQQIQGEHDEHSHQV